MKKGIREDILAFMKSTETGIMNTNKFIVEYIKYQYRLVNQGNILTYIELGTSVEGILRARRYVIKAHGIGVRVKADKESDYIEEYSLENKF